jgi:hypothetical protein
VGVVPRRIRCQYVPPAAPPPTNKLWFAPLSPRGTQHGTKWAIYSLSNLQPVTGVPQAHRSHIRFAAPPPRSGVQHGIQGRHKRVYQTAERVCGVPNRQLVLGGNHTGVPTPPRSYPVRHTAKSAHRHPVSGVRTARTAKSPSVINHFKSLGVGRRWRCASRAPPSPAQSLWRCGARVAVRTVRTPLPGWRCADLAVPRTGYERGGLTHRVRLAVGHTGILAV